MLIFNKTEKCKKKGCILKTIVKSVIIIDKNNRILYNIYKYCDESRQKITCEGSNTGIIQRRGTWQNQEN